MTGMRMLVSKTSDRANHSGSEANTVPNFVNKSTSTFVVGSIRSFTYVLIRIYLQGNICYNSVNETDLHSSQSPALVS